ncbi:tRNA lysidine(34) synthetase TilS [Anoxybacteroides amylolyticum]|uniref:tRNA(Ile)-lysidine synthase n=1 Tax=Anoxybacteroides amylolyticum TaxID=294699 RepID=A0A160F3S1_9BACL|nr:tRNA lysidine(34) synthetase TilS [Anoxybacillus amylolyticus]ANB60611.1 tRNA(Ile)-lysidine synthase [Anoxybacillus amylolyticus]
MRSTVCSFIKKHQLLIPNTTVVVGVSGGPDSLALLHFFYTIQKEWNLTLIAAHVDHMFRGRQSEEEMHFVKHFCDQLGIICEAKQIDVPAFQRQTKMGAQEAARECRYRFFQEVMEKHAASFLTLAHHGDDQIETILMRIVRGSSKKGYAGIPYKRPFHRGYIIRPFLCVSRAEIEMYCQKHCLQPRYDASNEKDNYTRNRFRHIVLPFLKKENPRVHERFQHYSEMVLEDEAFLEELTYEAMNNVMETTPREVRLHIRPFQAMPKPLQRRGIQLILNYLYDGIPSSLSFIHISSTLALLTNNHPSGRLDFPDGLKIIRAYDVCYFTFQEKKADDYVLDVSVPATIYLPNGHVIVSEFREHYPEEAKRADVFVVSLETITFPLRVRTRRTGDRMTVKGMDGTKKLKEIFIEHKIPLHDRNMWPVVEDGQGRILWLPKLKKSAFEATDITKTCYLVLHYKEQ